MALSRIVSIFSRVGKAFYISRTLAIAPSEETFIAFKTNGSIASIESIAIGGSVGDVTFSYHVGGTFTESNPLITHRYNRLIEVPDDGSNTTAFNPVIVTTEGLEIHSFKTFAIGGSGSNTSPNSISGAGDYELILPEDEIFIIKINNTDASNVANINIGIQWIEKNIKE